MHKKIKNRNKQSLLQTDVIAIRCSGALRRTSRKDNADIALIDLVTLTFNFLTSNKMCDQYRYYPPAKFDDDISSGFCFRVLTYTHIHTYTHMYIAAKRPTHAPATTSAWVIKLACQSFRPTDNHLHFRQTSQRRCITVLIRQLLMILLMIY